MGLAFNNLSDGKLTLIERLKKQGVIKNAIFSFYLSDDDYGDNPSEDHTSVMLIGGYDTEKYA